MRKRSAMRTPTHATLSFPGGHQAQVLYTPQGTSSQSIITALDIAPPRGVLIFNGGTAQLSDDLQARLGQAVQDGVARVAAEARLTLVTGATDAGVFTLLGQGLERWGHSAPCIGVTVASLVQHPAPAPKWIHPSPPEDALTPLEPHHSHFILVEGEQWGDETATLFAVAEALSAHAPSVLVFASGGSILRREIVTNVRQRRPLICIAGSGRFADELAAVLRGERAAEAADVEEIVRDGQITLFDLRQPPEELAALIQQHLSIK